VSMSELDAERAWELLGEVMDPEIPVVSLVEMGIVREVAVEGSTVHVTLTPTFTGCPAFHVMKEEVEARLKAAGAGEVQIRVTHSPPWSSDWISPEAREKLKKFGLAPPGPAHLLEVSLLEVAHCPYCDSANTRLKNSFGPTLCRAIYYCQDCSQPFEQFKPI
jgi:ring-1,2-phenylacetyl-CoA epoxidase subunit PaaD